jgi:molybdopterin molybdotransferase
VAALTFEEARACVIERVRSAMGRLSTETIRLEEAGGRVLAEFVRADRDIPAVARSIRDGFALKAAELPGEFRVIGEVRAGEVYSGAVGPREAVEIMTGAPIPPGADTVIMVEHTEREGERVRTSRTQESGTFINPQGSEAKADDALLGPGQRLGFAEIALLAAVGRTTVQVYRKPSVAILPTGDEIVEVGETPLSHQIRNSNSYSLAEQVRRAGGIPTMFPVAHDNRNSTRALVEQGLATDLLLLSGGVSAGKYDIVESVLADLGAEFYFDRVAIQPGQPLVFGRARGIFFFGLPGNPASTMVTFEVFARAAVEMLGGESEPNLRFLETRLAKEFKHKTGLTRFLPASLDRSGTEVTPVPWQGSSDIAALARANAFLVAEAERPSWQPGDRIRILVK